MKDMTAAFAAKTTVAQWRAASYLRSLPARLKEENGAFDKLVVTIILVGAAVILGIGVIAWFRGKAGDISGDASTAIDNAGTFDGNGGITL